MMMGDKMKRILKGLAAALWLAGAAAPAAAEEAPGAGDEAAIRAVIQSQLEAFQRDDGVAAFSYAAPNIQLKFATPEIFMSMVRTGYQAVYRPQEVRFLEALTRDGEIAQAVRFVGPDGAAVIAVYLMERQPDGSWRIAGVHLFPVDERTS